MRSRKSWFLQVDDCARPLPIPDQRESTPPSGLPLGALAVSRQHAHEAADRSCGGAMYFHHLAFGVERGKTNRTSSWEREEQD
jgi:hypothetical protein